MHKLTQGHAPGLILLLLSICIAMGAGTGCRTTDDRQLFRDALDANIPDSDRRAQIQEVFDRRSDKLDAFLREVEVLGSKFQNAMASLGSRPGRAPRFSRCSQESKNFERLLPSR